MTPDANLLSVPKGTVIFRQDDPGDCAYIIETGEVEIAIQQGGDRIVLSKLRQGELFGEMAILDQTRRSASAVAAEDCELFPISRDQLAKRIERADPVLRLCMNVILKRFRSTMKQWCKTSGDETVSRAGFEDGAADHEGVFYEIKLEQELRRALDQGEFEVHYQPILSLREQRVAGFEALIRWRHPVRGIISPALFMPTAEANGLIVDISEWVLNEACMGLCRLNRLISDDHPLFMSVNVSSRDIEDGGFLQRLDAALARAELDPARLKLEITESLLMEQPDIAVEVLSACRKRGLTIAIDDFGTGYSSLRYLHRFPIDMIKVDRSFVGGIDESRAARQIIAAIIGLARQLGLPVVAEGIEEPTQEAWLRKLGCEFGQGFLYAKALPEAEASALLQDAGNSIEAEGPSRSVA